MGENILNRTIRDKMYDHAVPIDHEMLWANIQKEKSSKPAFLFWLLGVGLLLVICLSVINLGGNANAPLEPNQKKNVLSLADNETIEDENIQAENIENEVFVAENKLRKEDNIVIKDGSFSLQKNNNEKKSSNAEIFLKPPNNKDLFDEKNIAKTKMLTIQESNSNNDKPINNTLTSNSIVSAKDKLNAPVFKSSIFNQLPHLLGNEDKLVYESDKLKIGNKRKQIGCFDHKIKRNSFGIEVYGGPGLVSKHLVSGIDGYKNLLDKRKETETTLESLRAGLAVRFNHNTGIYIKAGIEATRLRERMDYSVGKDTSYTLENQIIDYEINGVGDSIPVIGDVIITESSSKTWKIYNQFKTLDIPITLGYQHRVGNWGYFGEAGVIFNLSLKNEGMVLDPSYVPSDLTPLFENNNGMHLTASFGVSYQFTKNFYAYVSPSLKFSRKNFNVDSYPIDQKFHSYSILFGVGYTFVKGPKTL